MGDSCKYEPLLSAGNGWCNRFKRRAGLHNLKLTGEAASTDIDATSTFSSGVAKLIEQGGCCASQMFNVDETTLFWKQIPTRTCLAKEEKAAQGHKPAKDRLTLLLGGNA
jgi:hypothetical protein